VADVVVVVGAGIVGAAVAYESARAGASVTLLDKALPASGATGDSFAWIGGPGGRDVPDGSWPLRRRVLQEYRRLERAVPGVRVRWTGSLSWDEGDPPRPDELAPDERVVDAAEVADLEPRLSVPPARALLKGSDGAIDPVATTDALVRAAREHGARLRVCTVATGIEVQEGHVSGVHTSEGFLPCRTVVIAAGVDAPLLCAPLGFDLPVAPAPALLLRVTGSAGLVRTLLASPVLEVREAAEGELLVALAHDGEVGQADLDRTAHEALSRLAATFAGATDVRLVGIRLAARPMPADGLPIVGPLPGVDGVYVAVMHSGVTLAPVVARLVAAEVVNGVRAGELDGVRPDRFVAGNC
jgi:glycine/D-amino acid oxidase-like deaminating enzyme